MKDVQATGEAFSAQKKISSTTKHETFCPVLFLWVIFFPPGSYFDIIYGNRLKTINQFRSMWDPDPQHGLDLCLTLLYEDTIGGALRHLRYHDTCHTCLIGKEEDKEKLDQIHGGIHGALNTPCDQIKLNRRQQTVKSYIDV